MFVDRFGRSAAVAPAAAVVAAELRSLYGKTSWLFTRRKVFTENCHRATAAIKVRALKNG